MFRLLKAGSSNIAEGKPFIGKFFCVIRRCNGLTSHPDPPRSGQEGETGDDGPPAGGCTPQNDSNSSKPRSKIVDQREGSMKRLETMRARMRQLHGLDLDYRMDGFSDSTFSNTTTSPLETPLPSDHPEGETQDLCVDPFHDDDATKRQSRFLRRIKSGQDRRKRSDKLISAPFGLVRIDSMNLLRGGKSESGSNVLNTKDRNRTVNSVGAEEVKKSNRAAVGLSKLKPASEFEMSQSVYELKQSQEDDLEDSSKRNYSFLKQKSSDEIMEQNEDQPVENTDKYQFMKTETSKDNIFDEQYFGSHISDSGKSGTIAEAKTSNSTSTYDNIFEDQYFGTSDPSSENSGLSKSLCELAESDLTQNIIENKQRILESHQKVRSSNNLNLDSSNLFEAQFFEEQTSKQMGNAAKIEFENINRRKPLKQMASEPVTNETDDTIFHEGVTRREIKQRSTVIANTENPTTAYDMAMKIRLDKKGKLNKTAEAVVHPNKVKWSGRVDSQGFRLLDDQVPNVQYMTDDALLSILKDSILYEDDNIIAIDKPYGLPSHGGPGIHQSIGKFLVPLAAKLDRTGQLGTLHLVHRLDKETTGIMVLAKTQQTAEMLMAMFKKRMIVKRYWAITKGIPNPTEGVIDIPMAEGTVQGRYRMELRPIYSNEDELRQTTNRAFGDRLEAITGYKVLSSSNSSALVECEPETGVKHQIRCHLAFGLNTPILGDHKFSHYSKLAPQKLYPEILQRLGIRQSKVRHLPMHLHAKVLILPEFRDGRNLFLSANLPKHFVQNMKWLKLQPPK